MLFKFLVLFTICFLLIICSESNFPFNFNQEFFCINDKNIVISPYSLRMALALTYEGAKGNSATELAEVCEFDTNDLSRQEEMSKKILAINEVSKDYSLKTVNRLFPDKTFQINADYENIIQKYYHSTIETLNFRSEPDQSRLAINDWVEENTNNLIKNLLPPNSISYLTRVVLVNAIYFKGFWKYQFFKEDTKDETFTLSDGTEITTPMMFMTMEVQGKTEYETELRKFNYYENSEMQMVELQYKGDNLAMYVILPNTKYSQNTNECSFQQSQLTAANFADWKSSMKLQELDVLKLPKFKFELFIPLNEYLEDMGIHDIFTINADLSGINSQEDLQVSGVFQKAFIEVNEEGTEAAAATAVVFNESAVIYEEPNPSFIANRPFYYIIQDKESEDIYFMGKINDPRLSAGELDGTLCEVNQSKPLVKERTNIYQDNSAVNLASFTSLLVGIFGFFIISTALLF